MTKIKHKDKTSRLAIIIFSVLFLICVTIGITLNQFAQSSADAEPVSAEQTIEEIEPQE